MSISASLKKKIDQIAESASDKKSENICIVDVSELSSLADAVIFCSGKSEPQLEAIRHGILKNSKGQVLQTGNGESGWIILDFGDVIVHVITQQLRDHYRLESIWGQGAVTYYV